MIDYLKRYGIAPFINAHDTITLYGGSRISAETREAMAQISRCFVDMEALQRVLGDHIAEATGNEGAYLTNGAAGGIQLCAAVCLAGGSDYAYRSLPETQGRDTVVVLHGQHNCYDKALEAAGARIRLVGDADEVLPFDLEGSLDERAAAVLYCPALPFARASLPLGQVVEIAHRRGVPVIVDAAAQLPPVENLWRYTRDARADMAIFSGGKTLCGPQASGLIVGKRRYIEDCHRFGAPQHGICRVAKTSREDMIGLCVALDQYLSADQAALTAALSARVDRILEAMSASPLYAPWRVEHGSVGQTYPRAFARIAAPHTAREVADAMRRRGIFIGIDAATGAVYLSPQNLTDEECETVCAALAEVARELCAE